MSHRASFLNAEYLNVPPKILLCPVAKQLHAKHFCTCVGIRRDIEALHCSDSIRSWHFQSGGLQSLHCSDPVRRWGELNRYSVAIQFPLSDLDRYSVAIEVSHSPETHTLYVYIYIYIQIVSFRFGELLLRYSGAIGSGARVGVGVRLSSRLKTWPHSLCGQLSFGP